MEKSKYILDTTDRDLQSHGHIETTCETIEELINDIGVCKKSKFQHC